ncbi:MAG: RimK family alpha-L-glutamate ligase [Pseudomonadota bacterium]
MVSNHTVVALGSRLRKCLNVVTLGIQSNFSKYSDREKEEIRNAPKIYYPGTYYADLFNTMGKPTFPSYHTYKFVQDKIKQTTLFQLLNIPHPKTRFFYGPRQKKNILDYFQYPFVAKIPRGSAMGKGVFLIRNQDDFSQYCDMTKVAYVQEFLPADRDIRVVMIGNRVAHAYWRIAAPGEFRSNVARGAEIKLDQVPDDALRLAEHTARYCGWDDVGMDILIHKGNYYVLEANMKYGKAGFQKAGIDYTRLMEQKIAAGEI